MPDPAGPRRVLESPIKGVSGGCRNDLADRWLQAGS
jgi:hypothetical protein